MRNVNKEKEMRLRQELKRKDRQEKIDKALADGGADRAARLMSLLYLQVSQLAITLEYFNNQLEEIGFKDGKTDSATRKIIKSFDEFFKKLSFLVSKDAVQSWANDLDKFGKMVNKFGGISNE